MSAVLDQDTLELLGVAYRDARDGPLDEPLPEKLRSLWEALSESERGDENIADRGANGFEREHKRRAHG